MFLLRCAFFLSIVYVGISCGVCSPRGPHTSEAVVAGEVSGLAAAAMARATDWCAERPAQCVRDAARLTALVEMTKAEPVSNAEEGGLNDEAPRVPMPVPNPRRRAARAVLTDAR